jgi:hypothetical protein
MLLQTNSYIVPKDKRVEHARLLRRFRQVLLRLGCDHFEVYEQVGANWNTGETTGRFVQIMRFRDRKHQQSVQLAERADVQAQTVVAEFCDLINFPYQQQQGLFAVGFYTSFLKMPPQRTIPAAEPEYAGAAELDSTATHSPEPGADAIIDEPMEAAPPADGEHGTLIDGELIPADAETAASQEALDHEYAEAHGGENVEGNGEAIEPDEHLGEGLAEGETLPPDESLDHEQALGSEELIPEDAATVSESNGEHLDEQNTAATVAGEEHHEQQPHSA